MSDSLVFVQEVNSGQNSGNLLLSAISKKWLSCRRRWDGKRPVIVSKIQGSMRAAFIWKIGLLMQQCFRARLRVATNSLLIDCLSSEAFCQFHHRISHPSCRSCIVKAVSMMFCLHVNTFANVKWSIHWMPCVSWLKLGIQQRVRKSQCTLFIFILSWLRGASIKIHGIKYKCQCHNSQSSSGNLSVSMAIRSGGGTSSPTL